MTPCMKYDVVYPMQNLCTLPPQVISKSKTMVESEGLKVIAVVGDNHSGVQAALGRIEQEDPGCVAVRCGAHSLQLLLGDVEDLPPINGALKAMDAVLGQTKDRKV